MVCAIGLAWAQTDDPGKKEKNIRDFREFRMKYIAQEMDLSEVQKKKFFEMYEDMLNSKRECYHEAREKEIQLKHNPNATEQDYEDATTALNAANEKWSNEEKIYNQKFSEFLSQKQIYKMREAENNFKSRMSEMKHSRKPSKHHKPEVKN